MQLHISEQAIRWYEEELNLKPGDAVRFYVKYGGCSSVQQGFSLGIKKDIPHASVVQTEVNGVQFFVLDEDIWYFDAHHLHVEWDAFLEEPAYEYKKEA